MEKMPSLNDIFLSIMASFIGFGLVIGIAQAAFDFGGGRSLFLAGPVFAQALGGTGSSTPAGVTTCPTGQVLKFSSNFAEGTGYCVAADIATTTPVVNNTCPEGYERTPALWTDEIKAACTLAAQKLKSLDPQCIVNALVKRDNAIIAGMDTAAKTIRNLIVARENGLKEAWLITDRKARRAAITAIWNKYRLDIRYMQRQSSAIKTNIWKQFNVDRKTCGIYATSDDYMSASVDSTLLLFAPTL